MPTYAAASASVKDSWVQRQMDAHAIQNFNISEMMPNLNNFNFGLVKVDWSKFINPEVLKKQQELAEKHKTDPFMRRLDQIYRSRMP